MIKRVLCVLCAVVFLFSAVKTVTAFANVEEDTKMCNLKIVYSKEGVGFKGLKIKIHRIAKALTDATFEKVSPYSSLPVSIDDLTSIKEQKETAFTFESYVNAQNLKPYKTLKTNSAGVANFENIKAGLYLVCSAENDEYSFDSFLVSLPFYQNEECCYSMQCQPKSSKKPDIDPKKDLKVVKLWKDNGHKQDRPSSVTIEILKNGKVKETVKLSSKNNWVYKFKGTKNATWSVIERSVPKNYSVRISQTNETFSLTNTHKKSEVSIEIDGPKTGDTFPFTFYLVTMCISGLLLIIFGFLIMRSSKK